MDDGLERMDAAHGPSSGSADHAACPGDARHRAPVQLGPFSARRSGRGVQPAGRFAVCRDGSAFDERHFDATAYDATAHDATSVRGEKRLMHPALARVAWILAAECER